MNSIVTGRIAPWKTAQKPPVVPVADQLAQLVGRWEGSGLGVFPTIDDFRYREVLDFTQRDPTEATLHYHQQTWLIDATGADLAHSHWESGFLIGSDNGQIELLNAQESRRVEVLEGTIRAEGSLLSIELSSAVHGHDGRMVSTRRVFRLDDRTLTYRVEMATSRVAQLQVHLEATLTRSIVD